MSTETLRHNTFQLVVLSVSRLKMYLKYGRHTRPSSGTLLKKHFQLLSLAGWRGEYQVWPCKYRPLLLCICNQQYCAVPPQHASSSSNQCNHRNGRNQRTSVGFKVNEWVSKTGELKKQPFPQNSTQYLHLRYLRRSCRCWSSGLWRRVDLWGGTDVSEERTITIFKTDCRDSMFFRNGWFNPEDGGSVLFRNIGWFNAEDGDSMFFRSVGWFNPEDGDSIFFRNVGIYLQVHTVSQPRTLSTS
jgi:hypothetical protein